MIERCQHNYDLTSPDTILAVFAGYQVILRVLRNIINSLESLLLWLMY